MAGKVTVPERISSVVAKLPFVKEPGVVKSALVERGIPRKRMDDALKAISSPNGGISRKRFQCLSEILDTVSRQGREAALDLVKKEGLEPVHKLLTPKMITDSSFGWHDPKDPVTSHMKATEEIIDLANKYTVPRVLSVLGTIEDFRPRSDYCYRHRASKLMEKYSPEQVNEALGDERDLRHGFLLAIEGERGVKDFQHIYNIIKLTPEADRPMIRQLVQDERMTSSIIETFGRKPEEIKEIVGLMKSGGKPIDRYHNVSWALREVPEADRSFVIGLLKKHGPQYASRIINLSKGDVLNLIRTHGVERLFEKK